jgi:hypothetical protein
MFGYKLKMKFRAVFLHTLESYPQSHPVFQLVFGHPFTDYPPLFNAQGSRLILVTGHVGEVALKQKGKTQGNSVYRQNTAKPSLNANVCTCLLAAFFFKKKISPMCDQTQGSGAVFYFSLLYS